MFVCIQNAQQAGNPCEQCAGRLQVCVSIGCISFSYINIHDVNTIPAGRSQLLSQFFQLTPCLPSLGRQLQSSCFRRAWKKVRKTYHLQQCPVTHTTIQDSINFKNVALDVNSTQRSVLKRIRFALFDVCIFLKACLEVNSDPEFYKKLIDDC